MSKGKLICIIGAPSSGKSTLAAGVHHIFKTRGLNSIFFGEAATDYIAEHGIPASPAEQMVVFDLQVNGENRFLYSKDYVICDSSSILSYIYFRQYYVKSLTEQDISVINHMQKNILKSLSKWDMIYYVPPHLTGDTDDGIRYHNEEEIKKLDQIIKGYLNLENIPYTDLSSIDIDDRIDYVIEDIINRR